MDQLSYLIQLVEEQNHMIYDIQVQIAQLQAIVVDYVDGDLEVDEESA